jgi:hypothetical protein
MEQRITRIAGFLAQMNRRLNRIETEFLGLRADLKEDVRALRDRMNINFRWIIVVMITMWVTIIVAILLK